MFDFFFQLFVRILCRVDMHARKLVFVLASAWVCVTAEHVYIPVKDFPALEARMLVEKTQLLT